jgi:hypothetical protein
MSIINCVVYDSNGAHFARKTKKEKDLTQWKQSFAEGTEESCLEHADVLAKVSPLDS